MRISCYAQASGRVQGVGFRYFVLREATQRGIGGWVCNCEDGSVQMLLQEKRKRCSCCCSGFGKVRCGFRWRT